MSVVETVLVFVGIPLAAFALLTLAVLGPGMARAPRYRPGGGWDYRPVWYLPHPEHEGPVSAASGRLAIEGSVSEPVAPTGGASGEW
ncbi:MAG TPA: hypothetical protein VMB79_17690 [Jatrophihabitans sp.]|nr:hypothetical protein [Jatrophihabitans sp.]